MRVTFAGMIGLLASIVLAGCGGYGSKGYTKDPSEKDSDLQKLTPYEACMRWNNALGDGKLDLARKLTSQTSFTYLQKTFKGLEGLSGKYRKSSDPYIAESESEVETRIDGRESIVVYDVTYRSGTRKRWRDRLLLEDGIWKVAPQYVEVQRLRDN